eukprot:gnl/MRDRNA2_/MRDRNA2_35462_c0_seq1.p1 gnl/MRDRNA2_/MRDRNA2_35462_c0~~gnl/MRDRNA2_/MRDRNA2_35462_c0_seq1.p1  ORF type:complete len:382 (+),score=80.07 gnl/MRDRNA2_/MRDRNA2_35462_c0_seq1:124-1146(+)
MAADEAKMSSTYLPEVKNNARVGAPPARESIVSLPQRKTLRIRGKIVMRQLQPTMLDSHRDIRPSIPDKPVAGLDLSRNDDGEQAAGWPQAPQTRPLDASSSSVPKPPRALHRGNLVPLLKQKTPAHPNRCHRPRALSPLPDQSATSLQLGIGSSPPQIAKATSQKGAQTARTLIVEQSLQLPTKHSDLALLVPSRPGLKALGNSGQKGKFSEYVSAKQEEGYPEETDLQDADWSLMRMLDPDEDLPTGIRCRAPGLASSRSLSRAAASSSARSPPPIMIQDEVELERPDVDSRKRGAHLPAGSVFTPAEGIFDPFGVPGNSFGWMAKDSRKTLRSSLLP